MHGPGGTGETEIFPSVVLCAFFVQDWLSADSHRRRTEVLTWAPIVNYSAAARQSPAWLFSKACICNN